MTRTPSMTNLSRVEPVQLAVFAPSPIVTVTVEEATAGGPEIHFHAGGQGFWVARMAARLGALTCMRPRATTPAAVSTACSATNSSRECSAAEPLDERGATGLLLRGGH
jgi:hypothetical protein